MTITHTQNRPYTPAAKLMVVAKFHLSDGTVQRYEFNWEDRAEVRNFASQSDRIIREGGRTELVRLDKEIK